MNVGPGMILWIINAPNITAVTISPGIPSAIIIINAPPAVALLAASGAMTPSYSPFPKFDLLGEAFFAWSYANIFEIEPPAAGKIPVKMPMKLDLNKLTHLLRIINIACLCSTLTTDPDWDIRGLLALLSSSTSVNNCEKANNPIKTGRNANPCLNSSKPKVNLATPLISSSPTVAANNPSKPAIKPLVIFPPDKLTVIVRAKIIKEK